MKSIATALAMAMAMAVLAFGARPASAQAAPVRGNVISVDAAGARITLMHPDPIPNLNMMAGMTMTFRVAEPTLLQSIQAGDKITFEADRVNGVVTITKMQKAAP